MRTTKERRRVMRFTTPKMARFCATAGLVIGGLTALVSVLYAINGATQASGGVDVPVAVRAGAGLAASGEAPDGTQSTVLITETAPFSDGLRLDLPGVEQGSWLEVDTDSLTLTSWGSTIPEQLLARGGFAVVGVCIGAGALSLRRLLLSIADGRPFDSANPARIATIAGLIVVASLASNILPTLGAELVLERLGFARADSPIFSEPNLSITSLLIAPILLALAEAFRRGTDLAREVEGLV